MEFNLKALTSAERFAVRETAAELRITEGEGGAILTSAESGFEGFSVQAERNAVHVRYRGISRLLRALACFIAAEGGIKHIEQRALYPDLGFLADNSRNAVLTLRGAKKLIRKLALFGFTELQLYTEDTYEVKGQPFFGYLRGRFTGGELRELNGYAARLGIELVPCIQTLAHLNGLTHWQPYQELFDTQDILLAGEEKTYALIEDMFRSLQKNFTSRRVNIGMDEAQLLGAGRYFSLHGYKPRYEILRAHLHRVLHIADRYGFHAMMWSDMFFRNWFGGDYYVREGALPRNAREKVPQNVQLLYWDYYHLERVSYSRMMKLHREVTEHVGFAGGAWKWSGFAPLTGYALAASRAALPAAGGAERLLLTAWGDNGGECSVFSVLPVAAYYAEACYGDGPESTDRLFRCATGYAFSEFVKLEEANKIGDTGAEAETNNSSKYLLYNDLLLGVLDSSVESDTAAHFAQNCATLASLAKKNGEFGYLFDTLAKLCDALTLKSDMGARILQLYRRGERDGLQRIAEEEIPKLLNKLSAFYEAFRYQWHEENKPNGFEVQDYRLGGLAARIQSCRRTLLDYALGSVQTIAELEEERLDFMGRDANSKDKNILYNNFAFIASPNVF